MKGIKTAALLVLLLGGCNQAGTADVVQQDEAAIDAQQVSSDAAMNEAESAEDAAAGEDAADQDEALEAIAAGGGLVDPESSDADTMNATDSEGETEGDVDPAEADSPPASGAAESQDAEGDAAETSDTEAQDITTEGEGEAETASDTASQPEIEAQPAVDAAPESNDAEQPEALERDESGAIVRAPDWVPADPSSHPLSVERMRGMSYPGSDLVVVEELPAGSNYSRAVATYQSEGLTIRGLLTIPNGDPPATGWPVVIFNHGYIPPAQYRTTERYVAYQDAFARAGYITYKSDYRGHGSSQGESGSSRGTPDYSIDVLNAMASVARHPAADENRIGMWGHSMGGLITLRNMVVSNQIKAGVIWAGVVASYPDLYNRFGQAPRPQNATNSNRWRRSWRMELVELFGEPEENPGAWDAVSPNAYLHQISGPLQLHHGTADSSVPVEYSTRLQEQMDAAGRPSETFIYQGDDHNLSASLSTALARSVEFFDRHVKGGG